ncbi:hypothetical protein ACHAW5_001577 [Stephanodiscus triporus]|uniref:MADF domain-containing protein n=1 Tax=Stephanodiscus triporus TaxID=2934178 RepID=A0ABD3NI05_9STRA
MNAESHQGPWSPSLASGLSGEPTSQEIIPAPAEISPGDGAYSPQNDGIKQDDGGDVEGCDDVGFGPPPAFPTSNKNSLRKRKHTLIAVSSSTAGPSRSHDDSSEEDCDKSGSGGRRKQSQMIHRIKKGGDDADSKGCPKTSEDDDGVEKQYCDAMLLASLSDVEAVSPMRQEEVVAAGGPGGDDDLPASRSSGPTAVEVSSPKRSPDVAPSSAPTPVRSNVNPNPDPVPVRPYALMPKPGPPVFSNNKRVKMTGSVPAAAPYSPDVRDPKAVTPMNERGTREQREEATYAHPPPNPWHHPRHQYPPGYHHPGYPPYPYPHHHPHPAPPSQHGHGHGHPTYPPGYPHAPPYRATYPQAQPGSGQVMAGAAPPPYHHPRPYYPPGHPAHAPPSSSGNQIMGGSPEMILSRAESHVVPSEDGEPASAEGGSAPAHDPYEPYDYAPIASPPHPAEAHYQVPAAVSNEVETHRGGGDMGPTLSPRSKHHQFRKGGRSIHSEPVILRKKFSWRNYPELEEYLISNRADYLRHSALNYTAEQKHFNNSLTEGLLEVAARMNYVFDETCFNFVAVRDRIRCYYKSFVQSSKKRGVVVGFPHSPHDEGSNHNGDGLMGEA